MDLVSKKCVPCEGGALPLTSDEIREYISQLQSGWVVEGSKKIKKEFKFKNFQEALDFVNKVGNIAESENHHPDIFLSWGKVIVELWTHAIGGLSENDFIVAAKTDTLLK